MPAKPPGWFVKLRRWVQDPPPSYVFEISPYRLSLARYEEGWKFASVPIEPGVLNVNPVEDNLARPDQFFDLIQQLAPAEPKGRPRRAALILPDYAARVVVLDFDQFPSKRQEQESLIRLRLRKSIPFDLESAQLSYVVQQRKDASCELVVAVAALEIVVPYETAFRNAGFHPGHVTTSTLCALQLIAPDGVQMLAKLSGSILSVAALENDRLQLVRSLELADVTLGEILPVLVPSFASVEDRIGRRPSKLYLCGFGDLTGPLAQECQQEASLEVDTLSSRWGEPDGANAGLLGYLELTREWTG